MIQIPTFLDSLFLYARPRIPPRILRLKFHSPTRNNLSPQRTRIRRKHPLQDAKPNVPVSFGKVIYGFILALREPGLVFMNYCGFLSIYFSAWLYSAFSIDSGMNIKWEVMVLNWAADVAIYHENMWANFVVRAVKCECIGLFVDLTMMWCKRRRKFTLSCFFSFSRTANAITRIDTVGFCYNVLQYSLEKEFRWFWELMEI